MTWEKIYLLYSEINYTFILKNMSINELSSSKNSQDIIHNIDDIIIEYMQSWWRKVENVLNYHERKMPVQEWKTGLYRGLRSNEENKLSTTTTQLLDLVSGQFWDIAEQVRWKLAVIFYNRLILETTQSSPQSLELMIQDELKNL